MTSVKSSVELIAASEACRFIGKDRAKLPLVVGLYALSGVDYELGKVARASYFFLRNIDDILDGETSITGNPIDYAQDLSDQISTRRFNTASPMGRLASYSLTALERRSRPDDNPAEEFTRAIDAMLFDCTRRQTRQMLPTEVLSRHHTNSIGPVTNLMLIGFRSRIRALDIPNYAPNIGRLYSLRDLEKDWKLGMINVPAETLATASLTSSTAIEDLLASPVVQAWIEHEESVTRQALISERSRLAVADGLTRVVLGGFISQAIRAKIP